MKLSQDPNEIKFTDSDGDILWLNRDNGQGVLVEIESSHLNFVVALKHAEALELIEWLKEATK